MANGNVVFLPSPGDELAQIFSQLGAALPLIFNQEGLQRQQLIDQIRANPALGQQLASQYRTAVTESAGDANAPGGLAVAQMLGLDATNPENQQLLASIANSFPATLEEQLANLAVGTTGGALASPLAQQIHETTMTLTQAQGEEAKTSILANMNEQDRQRWLDALNYPLLAARYESATANLGLRTTDEHMTAWSVMDAFAEANPEYRWAIASGLVNQPFLSYMTRMQELSLQEKLSSLKANEPTDLVEVMAALTDLAIERNRLFNSITEAKKDANDETVAALNAQWNDLNATAQRIAQAAGIEWSTIAMPGSEEEPLTYTLPRSWKDYTATFDDAEQEARLDRAWTEALVRAGLEIAGGRNRSEVMNEMREQLPEFWEHLIQSQTLGTFFAEVNRWVNEQTAASARSLERGRRRESIEQQMSNPRIRELVEKSRQRIAP